MTTLANVIEDTIACAGEDLIAGGSLWTHGLVPCVCGMGCFPQVPTLSAEGVPSLPACVTYARWLLPR